MLTVELTYQMWAMRARKASGVTSRFWLEHLGKSRRGTGFGSREVARGGQEFSSGLVKLRCLLVIQRRLKEAAGCVSLVEGRNAGWTKHILGGI